MSGFKTFFKNLFESKKEEKERLEFERRMRSVEEDEGLEFPVVMDHNADGHGRADAADAVREAAREAERAYAAEIAGEIPEAQKAIQLLTEYWKNMNEYKARHMNADGLLISYSIQKDRPNKNFKEVHDACQAAAAAYRYKYEHSQDMEENKLFEKKFQKYQSYADHVYMSMRKHDDNIGMYNVQLGKFPSNWTSNGGKKSKYSRKTKSKYSRKSKSKYLRKSKSKLKSKYSRKY